MKTLTFSFIVFLTSACMLSQFYAANCVGQIVIPSNELLPIEYHPISPCGTANTITPTNVIGLGIYDPSFLNGHEVLFQWAPTNNQSNISFSYICEYSYPTYPYGVGLPRYVGLYLYKGHPLSVGSECIRFSSGNCGVTLPPVDLTSGNTYYLIIDTPVVGESPCPGSLTIQTFFSGIINDPLVINTYYPGACNGSIAISYTGGNPPFTFLWSNGATTMEIVGLCQGDYWVMVTEWNLGDSPTGTTSTFGPFTVGVANPVPEFFTATGTASSTVCYNATNTLTVQNFMVTNAGNVELVSGSKILIQPDMVVQNGGYLRAHISASYCNSSTGCPGYTAGLTNPETLSEATSQKLTLYPNPTSGSFILARKDDQLIGTVKVEIYTMSGNLLMTCQIEGEKQQNFPSFSSIPAGIYFVKVVTDNDIETFKVMKTR